MDSNGIFEFGTYIHACIHTYIYTKSYAETHTYDKRECEPT